MAGNSNSGRKPVPATVHMIRGNPSKKSAAELAAGKAAATKPEGDAPSCPDWLTKDAKAEWRRIVGALVILGLITKIDRAALVAYCVAWGDFKLLREKIDGLGDLGFVESTPSGYKQISAWMQAANRAEDRMLKAGALFGLNPSARQSLEVRLPQGELFPEDEKKQAADKYF